MAETKDVYLTPEQANELREECNRLIDLATCMDRLSANADYQKIFTEEYESKEPARLVKLLADPSLNMGTTKDNLRADLQERMIGIARFNEFVRSIYTRANMAKKQLNDLNEAISGNVQ